MPGILAGVGDKASTIGLHYRAMSWKTMAQTGEKHADRIWAWPADGLLEGIFF